MIKKITAILSALLIVLLTVTSAAAFDGDNPSPLAAPADEAAAAAQAEEPVPVSAEEALAPVAEPTEAPTEPAEAMPVITAAEPVKDGVKLSFTAYDGAARYRIFIKKPDGSGWRGVGDTAALSFTRTGMADYSTDIYTVRALDANGRFCSSFDKEGFSYTYLPAPKLKKAESITGGVKVMWDAVNGAPGYRVYAKTTGSWKCLGETADTSFTDGNVTSGTTYTYTVKVRDNENGVLLSYHDTTGIKVTYVAAPVLGSVNAVDGGNKITWKKSDGAAKYRVFTKKPDGSGWKGIGDTAATSFIHKLTTNNTTNTYTVRALNAKGAFISGYDKEGLTATYYSTPVLGKVTNENGGQRISWQAVPGAVNYKVYLKAAVGWSAIGYTGETSFLYTQAVSGTANTYTVRVCTADQTQLQSFYDRNGVSGAYVAAPEITGFTPVEGGTKIKWNKSEGASKYRVFYKKEDGSGWKGIGDTTGTSLTHTDPTDQTVYTYTVRALNAKGAFISGYNQGGWDYRYIAPTAITRVRKTSQGMTLSWSAVDNVAGFRVYRKTIGSSWKKIADTFATSYTDTTSPANVPYTYTLRALDADGSLLSYYFHDTLYYYNGALADGNILVDGVSLHFENGHVRQGFVTIDGKTYYYNSEGVVEKNGVVGSDEEGWRYAGEDGVIDEAARLGVTSRGCDWNVIDGVAEKVVTDKDRVLHSALKLVAQITTPDSTKIQKLRKCFDYLLTECKEYSPRIPHYRGMDWPEVYANDIFTKKGGNCFSHAASLAYMAKAIGGFTTIRLYNNGYHGFAEIDGLIYDPEWQRNYHKYNYFGLSYSTKVDVDYPLIRIICSEGDPWMIITL